MIFEYKIKNKERIIVLKDKGVIKAESVLIYGCKPSIKGKLLCVLKNKNSLYGFVVFKQKYFSLESIYSSGFKYLNWQTANKEGINIFKNNIV